MADVAARVGVSKMTVSRALHRSAHGGTSDRTTSEALRLRIVKACNEMGYVIDQTARTFSSKRSGFVAALIPALNNSNFSDTAHGLAAAAVGDGRRHVYPWLALYMRCSSGRNSSSRLLGMRVS